MQIKIEERDRVPVKLELGKLYHLTWANPACVWRLKGIGSTGQVEMETPKTKKKLFAKADDLRLTNNDALEKAKKRLKL